MQKWTQLPRKYMISENYLSVYTIFFNVWYYCNNKDICVAIELQCVGTKVNLKGIGMIRDKTYTGYLYKYIEFRS